MNPLMHRLCYVREDASRSTSDDEDHAMSIAGKLLEQRLPVSWASRDPAA
jgi:hypothetical protein